MTPDLEALRRVATLLDEAVAIPGTRQRVGLDAALGLVPWVGDLAAAAMSAWILAGAVRHRVPKRKVGLMLANVLVDLVVGAIPVVGDIFDALFKQNVGNVKILLEHRDATRPPRSYAEIGFVVAGLVAIVMGTGLAAVVGVAWIIWQAATYLFGAVG
ncbi:MAG: DUF4112 domain-containing protein [Thermoanaerobaculia bacterium]